MTTFQKFLLTATTLSISACSLVFGDPCANRNNWNFQSAGCDACDPSIENYSPEIDGCDDNTGGTGGDPFDGHLRCNPDDLTYCVTVGHLGDVPWPEDEFNVVWHGECLTLSEEVPCHRTWWGTGDARCLMCTSNEYLSDTPLPSPSPGWNVCGDGQVGSQSFFGFKPARVPSLAGANVDWLKGATCSAGYTPLGHCPLGPIHLTQNSQDYFDFLEDGEIWTCACEADSDCPDATVCEAGYALKPGEVIPTPSMCKWDEANTGSGAIIYGLDQLEDLVRVGPGRWTIILDGHGSRDELNARRVALLGLAAPLWNDAQAFDGLTVTRCDSGSLCDYLGLAVGDEPGLGLGEINALADNGETLITIHRAAGSVDTVLIQVELH